MVRKVQCLLCPKKCILGEGQRSDCRVRLNLGGDLKTLIYGKVCAANVDPIEKKPLYHFQPSTWAFSIATAGCNLHCKFCQNWAISQQEPEKTRNLDLYPAKVVNLAMERNCASIAYTYSEPVIFFEYMIDTCRLAHQKGVRNVWVTAGFINQEPLRELCRELDGANIDLKSINEWYYREVCNAELKPVLETIVMARKNGVWVELTNLVVPTLNDTEDDFKRLSRWIKENAGTEVPLHFSRFWPMYKLQNLPPTRVEKLNQAREIAMAEGLKYVYIGNVPGNPGSNTYCPECRKVVIKRVGYQTDASNLEKGNCRFCGQPIRGIWG